MSRLAYAPQSRSPQVPVEFTFIRHGQTTGNAVGRWQGHTNSSLTDLGRNQAKRLATRLERKHFDLVVSSDLDRTLQTADALGRAVEADKRWREPFFGSWEDRTTAEIMEMDPGNLAALFAGRDIAIGGGETASEVVTRTTEALAELVDRVGDGSVAVVSHGMALLLLFASLLGTRSPAPFRLLGNTSVATVVADDGFVSVTRYNDDTHLGSTALPHFGSSPSDTELWLIRHGQTDANVEGRWHGHTNGKLNEEGLRQAARLGSALPSLSALYTSPLSRAADTAAAVARHQCLTPAIVDDLKEIGFGEWEGMTRAEVEAAFPEEYGAYSSGVDFVRGGSGESFDGVRRRMAEAITGIVERHPGEAIAAVSHGGSTRAYVTGLMGIEYRDRAKLGELGNTGYARLAYTARGPSLVSWNLTPHLENRPA